MRPGSRPVSPIVLAAALLAAAAAAAQESGETVELEPVEVIGVVPTHGAELPRARIPANVQSASSSEIRESQAADLTEFLNQQLGSVHINDAQNNPLQKDVQYRGFVASPLLGQAQGLSIYQDGVRLNEPFGDAVNWATIPESAIASLDLIPGSNPLFGRNTLGGALSIRTKTGFSHPETGGELVGGSFERYTAQAETGGQRGDWGWFATGELFDEQGWRDYSPTEARKLFGNLSWLASEATSFDLSLNLAQTDLIGNGPAPVELLEQDRDAVFTRPDITDSDLLMFNLRGSHEVSPALRLTGNAYWRTTDTSTLNGDESDFAPCTADPALVCDEEDGEQEIVTDPLRGPVPATLATVGDAHEGGSFPAAINNRGDTEQDGYGASIQAGLTHDLAGRENQFIVGVEFDQGDIRYRQSSELGRLDETRLALGSGFFAGDRRTDVDSMVKNLSLYFMDTFAASDALSLTLAGRLNRTRIDIEDRSGLEPELDGSHTFNRVNPAVGATYAVSPALNLFGSYSESNRTPTPSELTCADPSDPCRLPNAFLADPPLDDVVARTLEAGVRGDIGLAMNYAISLFNTENDDDILFITRGNITGAGFFANAGDTRRRGIELQLAGTLAERIDWFINYSHLRAEFRERFLVASEEHEFADANGQIQVEPGDRIPLIPEHVLKAGVDVQLRPDTSVGLNVVYNGDQVLRGDESNQLDRIAGYTLVNLSGRYWLSDRFAIVGRVTNLFDKEHETFGLLGEEPGDVLLNDFEDPRFLGSGPPRAFWVGLRASF